MSSKVKRPSWFKLWLHHRPLIDAVPDDVAGRAIKAALNYFATGEVVQLGQLEMAVFASIKSDIDDAHADYLRDVENGKKGGRPKLTEKEKPTVRDGYPPLPTVTEGEREGEREGEIEGDEKSIKAGKPPTPVRKEFSQYGWVKLTQGEYDRLVADLGETEAKRCIDYIDEAAQSTRNKNHWKDWNLVVRRCHRDGWGKNTPPQGGRGSQMPDYGGADNWSL